MLFIIFPSSSPIYNMTNYNNNKKNTIKYIIIDVVCRDDDGRPKKKTTHSSSCYSLYLLLYDKVRP